MTISLSPNPFRYIKFPLHNDSYMFGFILRTPTYLGPQMTSSPIHYIAFFQYVNLVRSKGRLVIYDDQLGAKKIITLDDHSPLHKVLADLPIFVFKFPIKSLGGTTIEKYQKSITVNNHSPLHEVLINKTADFATVDFTNLFSFFSSHKNHQVAPPKRNIKKVLPQTIIFLCMKSLLTKLLTLQQQMPPTFFHF